MIEEKKNNKSNDIDSKKLNSKKEEKNKETKNDKEIKNGFKNASSIIRGVGEIGGILLKTLPEAGEITLESGVVVARTGINAGLKIVSWILLPITCIGFGTWSVVKVHQDCQKIIINTFDRAFNPLRFETLFKYVSSIKNAINHLEYLGQKIIQDDKEENNLYMSNNN